MSQPKTTRSRTSRAKATKVTARRASSDEDDLEFEEDFMSDEEYFVAELRGAVARAMSSVVGSRDLHDGPWGGGFDRLQIDLAD